MMPKQDGFKTLKLLKEDKATTNIPVVVSSILTLQKDVDESMTLGAEKYVKKPDVVYFQLKKSDQ